MGFFREEVAIAMAVMPFCVGGSFRAYARTYIMRDYFRASTQ